MQVRSLPGPPQNSESGLRFAATLLEVAGSHDLPIDQYREADLRIINGDTGAYKRVYSHRDDATLANPFGPPVRGWADIEQTLERAASHYQDGELVEVENIATVVGSDLAYTVEIERFRARVGGGQDFVPVSLRVTTAFRIEDGEWKVVHRHADSITSARPAESVIEN